MGKKIIDLTGKKFGRWTVIERVEHDKKEQTKWKCICECGNEKIIYGTSLKQGTSLSCRCLQKELIDLTNQKFGKLTVIKFLGDDEYGNKQWLCKCDCGVEKSILSGSFKRGLTKSCGCLHKEIMKEVKTTHGYANKNNKSVEYLTWASMLDRCRNKNNKSYKNYGGRGIEVCDRWTNSFENFLEDMGKRPSNKHSIDRINVNDNYEPNNCRWATTYEQSINRRMFKNNKSGYVGVFWNKKNKNWNSKITVNKVQINLGSFKNLDDAINIRKEAEIKYLYKTSL